MAELYGREAGVSRGRGGSMHLFAPEVGLMGTTGIVGPNILQASGAAYTFKLLKTSRVAVSFFGDGAVSNGAFHEGINLAAAFQLPAIFVCENNLYATEVAFSYATRNPDVASRGPAYGLPAVAVDGNDVLAVRAAAGEAIRRAKAGEGPTLIEARTYRTRAHAEGMGDFTYRTKEDVEEWKTRCPIKTFREHLLSKKLATEAQLAEIDAAMKAEAAEAQKFAEASPWPDPATATTHVFAEPTPIKPMAAGAPMREVTIMQATLEALRDEMEVNPAIFVMGEGIGVRGGNFKTTFGLFEKHGPVRLCDTPICERGFVGLAGGAAMTGSRPVIDFMFADFVLDGLGEIINQIAKMQYMSSGRLKMPVLLRGCIGIGHSAATHHSGSYHTLFAHCPGLRVVVPSNPRDAKGLMKHALRCNDPVVFLEHREILTVKGMVPDDEEIPFGQAAVVREGKDVTVVALALMVQHALKVCDTLAKEGLSVELIDPRTVAPLDTATILTSVKKTGRLLIADGAFGPFGLGSEIAACIADEGFNYLDAPVKRLHGVHCPTPYSPPLEAAVAPGVKELERAVRELLAE